jgi:N-acetylglucosaminyldiphosphoundecaprenol N-acetyl-beta-D-mannosaminyltransferase
MTSRARNYSSAPPAVRTSPSLAGCDRGHDALRKRFSVLGVAFDALQIPDVMIRMRQWIARREACRYIAVTGMHGITEARHNAEVRNAIARAELVVADGMPVVWIGRWLGHSLARRVYGPELMFRFCWETASTGCRHYFFGGAPGVVEQLVQSLEKKCPGIVVAGAYSPPFRPSTPEEDAAIVSRIMDAAPDVLWVGLGTPKQEIWMHQHRDKLRVPVMIGVGAAFDFLSARKRQAPSWMRERGLEWLFRLVQEPMRLWKRYLVGGSEFVVLVLLQLLGLRRFD